MGDLETQESDQIRAFFRAEIMPRRAGGEEAFAEGVVAPNHDQNKKKKGGKGGGADGSPRGFLWKAQQSSSAELPKTFSIALPGSEACKLERRAQTVPGGRAGSRLRESGLLHRPRDGRSKKPATPPLSPIR